MAPRRACRARSNTLLFEGAGIRAENTDGAGLLAALADLGAAVAAGNVVVMAGAGGAAAGAVEALTRAGARGAPGRAPARRRGAAARAPPRPARARVTVAAWTGDGLARALDGAGVLVSAVPAAAWADAATAAGLATLAGDAAVLEMAYGGETPLAVAARAAAPATPTASACWSTRPPTRSRWRSARPRPWRPCSKPSAARTKMAPDPANPYAAAEPDQGAKRIEDVGPRA